MAIVKVVKSIYTGADVTSLGELVSGDTVNLPTGSQVNSSDIVTDADIGVSVQAFDATILVDADIGVNVQAYDATIVVDADIGVSVQGYDATILVDADIGVNVQAYDATIVVDADIGVSVQGYDATILVDADIGVNVQAYDSNLTSFVGTFTLPTTDGTADQLLKTNGGGTLSFTTPAPAFTTGKAIAMAIVFGF
tara:strand:+ start:1652 stop:2236 length:585 start_codon:yes stop_codon:yes gene_type:complete